ncbi:MAG TPA: RNA 2',3'-cyclic phosphodiesterase [Bryobacteraceae bacterium]|nr:RNA 2',3'-cyclic phosphodiesterase [Bryobacteraceae bacterium]
MRLFTGLDLPAEVVRNLEQLLDRLRPAARIQWSPPANLHVTTKFIGEWPDGRLEELKAALHELPPRTPILVRVRQLGFFPNPRSPRVFWCGVESPGLSELAAETDRATSALGIAAETRPFSPHLTLARIKERLNPEPLWKAIEALPSTDFGVYQAASFFLYRSQLRRGGSVYTKLAEFPLAK